KVSQEALHSNLNLPLDERFRNFELVVLFKPTQQLLPQFFIRMFAAMLLQILPDLFAKFLERRVLTQALGELIVQLGNFLLLDGFHLYVILESLPGETLLRIIVAIRHAEGLFLIDRGSGEFLRELL